MDRTLKCVEKLLSSTLLWCCLFFNFTQSVPVENLSGLDLALLRMKGLMLAILFFNEDDHSRVVLSTVEESPGSDYINASRVDVSTMCIF